MTKYEELRAHSQLSFLAGDLTPEAGSNDRVSELHLYRELERELHRILGLPMPPSPSKTHSSSKRRVGFAVDSKPSVARSVDTSGAITGIAPRARVGAGTDVAIESAGSAPGLRKKQISILVVDDSPISCKLARRVLQPFDFHVEVRRSCTSMCFGVLPACFFIEYKVVRLRVSHIGHTTRPL